MPTGGMGRKARRQRGCSSRCSRAGRISPRRRRPGCKARRRRGRRSRAVVAPLASATARVASLRRGPPPSSPPSPRAPSRHVSMLARIAASSSLRSPPSLSVVARFWRPRREVVDDLVRRPCGRRYPASVCRSRSRRRPDGRVQRGGRAGPAAPNVQDRSQRSGGSRSTPPSGARASVGRSAPCLRRGRAAALQRVDRVGSPRPWWR